MENPPAPPPESPLPPHPLRRYWRIYTTLWRNAIVREMQFKANFILWIVVELLWLALQLCFINVLYLHTENIGTWTKWEVVLLVGASHFIQQMFTALFLNNCSQLSEHIRTGRLDFMLLLPVNTRFLLSFRMVDWGSFFNAGSAIAVIVYALRQLHITPGAAQVAAFFVLAVAGIAIHYSLMFALASVSFWTVRAQGIVWGYYNLFNLARWPDEAFHGMFKAFFTFALPMLLVANVPAKLLAHHLNTPWEIVVLLLMSLLCFVFSEGVWRLSLRRYTSASS